jgi:tetratricopeptide (TPR) repeat protein
LEAAVADFSDSIRLNPENALAYDERGFALMKLGQHMQAINDFSSSFEMNPLNVKTFVNRGTSHAKVGNYAQAVADYDEALKIDPTHASAMHNRAVALTKLGMLQQALDGFSRLIEMYPEDANAHFCRGSAYVPLFSAENRPVAILCSSLRRCWRCNTLLAARLDAMGEYEAAVEDYTRALDLEGSVGSWR